MNEMYLTPEDCKIAENNGIPEHVVRDRFYNKFWSKRRALSEPYKPRPKTHLKYAEALKESGVKRSLFYHRVRDGWTEEKAATTPVMTREETIKRMLETSKQNTRITKDIRALAEANGIPKGTLEQRVYKYGKDPIKAATEPVKSQFNWRKNG